MIQIVKKMALFNKHVTAPGGETIRGVVWAHCDGGEVQLTEPHSLDGAGGGVLVPGPEQLLSSVIL